MGSLSADDCAASASAKSYRSGLFLIQKKGLTSFFSSQTNCNINSQIIHTIAETVLTHNSSPFSLPPDHHYKSESERRAASQVNYIKTIEYICIH